MIEFTDVVKNYSPDTHALKGVDIQIDDGEFVFLVGPSGSGKSTIIKLITGELKPTSGSVHVNGYSLERIRKREIPYLRRTVGVVFQDFRLIATKTVYENLAFAMRAVGAQKKEIEERIPYILELVGMEDKANRHPNELSGGEQQRLAIARALVNNPSTIIADEPTGNLDPARALEIMVLLQEINNLGTTVLVVTHAQELVERFEKRVIAIDDGVVVHDGMGITTMKCNNFGYLLKEGFLGIFRHGFMSFAAVIVTVACLLIVGSFSSLTYNVNIMVEDLNKTNEILVYVDSELPDAEARSIGTKINMIDNVLRADFIPREQALAEFIADHQDEEESFSGLDATDLRHRFRVVLEDNHMIKETDEAIKAIPGVVKTVAEYEMAQGFSTIQDVLQLVSLGVIAVLLAVSLLIISNTVKLAMYDRKEEIGIMKMVGATNGFIRLPFVVEGFTLGMLGAALAFGLEWVMYDAMIRKISEVDALQLFKFVPFQELLMPMIVTFAAAGMFVGIVGSWTSIRKFLNV